MLQANYVIPAFMCIIILLIFQIPAYVAGENLPAVVGLFLIYGWAVLSHVPLWSAYSSSMVGPFCHMSQCCQSVPHLWVDHSITCLTVIGLFLIYVWAILSHVSLWSACYSSMGGPLCHMSHCGRSVTHLWVGRSVTCLAVVGLLLTYGWTVLSHVSL